MSHLRTLPRSSRTALAAPAALAVFAALAAPAALHAQGTPTSILVRVVSHDAKIIGSGVGGARVVIREAATGAVLAEGVQEGGTGNTASIMIDPRVRGATVFDTEGAAGYLATFDLERPTVIEIAAEGPLGDPDGLYRATKTMLMVPGKDVLGEGVVIELLGFTVKLLAPESEAPVTPGERLSLVVRVTMLCGCPTEPGGLWDADHIEIVALISSESETLVTVPLEFTGERSTYGAEVVVPRAESLELLVVASNPATGNFGMVARPLRVGSGP